MSGLANDGNEIFIVTGSVPAAELHDRPEAYRVRDALAKLVCAGFPDRDWHPVVCADLWYLNQDHLRARPAVSVGPPHSSAFAAFLADRLPSLRVVDGLWMVQAEPDFDPPLASCWGATPHMTSLAVGVFLAEYAQSFLEAVESRYPR
ncbi:MAG: hypothetical protein ACOYN0_01165 [Phycisphaerales bacterium]